MAKGNAAEELKSYAAGHREREYDRVLTNGCASMTDAQLLEDLLFYAVPRVDTKPTARLLAGRFSTFARVVDAGEAELMQVDGVGKRTAAYLKLIGEACRRYGKSAVGDTADLSRHSAVLARVTADLDGLEREQAHVYLLDGRFRLVGHTVLGLGSSDRVGLEVRELCEEVLRAGCRYAVLAHNHPSGEVKPSLSDDMLTEEVLKAFSLLHLNLLDHVIVGYHSGCYSYKNSSEFSERLGRRNGPRQGALDETEFIYDTKGRDE